MPIFPGSPVGQENFSCPGSLADIVRKKPILYVQDLIENRLVVAKGEDGRSRIDGEFGVGRSKLLYLEWISNEVLLYGTGNYIQSLGINHNGR